MLRLRTIALLVTIALVAAACASPGAGTSPDSSESPPAVGGDSTEAPGLNDLRVPTEGWSTDFSIASVDLGEF